MIFVYTPQHEALDAGFRFGQRLCHAGIDALFPDGFGYQHPYLRDFCEGVEIAFELESRQAASK